MCRQGKTHTLVDKEQGKEQAQMAMQHQSGYSSAKAVILYRRVSVPLPSRPLTCTCRHLLNAITAGTHVLTRQLHSGIHKSSPSSLCKSREVKCIETRMVSRTCKPRNTRTQSRVTAAELNVLSRRIDRQRLSIHCTHRASTMAAWPNGKASDYDSQLIRAAFVYIRRSWVRAPSWSKFWMGLE